MMDKWIGRLIERVEDLGIADNTAIAFISDHGWYHGEHGYIGKHTVLDRNQGWQYYDEVARIPLLIRAPNLQQGVRSNLLMQPVDVGPTLMEIIGLEAPQDVHGKSALPALMGKGEPPREIAVTARDLRKAPGYRTYSAIHDGTWTMQHAAEAAEPELHNVVQDPKQEHNVIADNTELASGLLIKYLEYLREIGAEEEQIDGRRPLGPR